MAKKQPDMFFKNGASITFGPKDVKPDTYVWDSMSIDWYVCDICNGLYEVVNNNGQVNINNISCTCALPGGLT